MIYNTLFYNLRLESRETMIYSVFEIVLGDLKTTPLFTFTLEHNIVLI